MMPMAAHHAASPMTAPLASGGSLWHRVNHGVDQAITWVSHLLPWLTVGHLAEVVVIGIPTLVLLATLRTLTVWRVLETRQTWVIIPTERFQSSERTDETAYKNFSNALSHVRLRATSRQWWLRRSGALRVRLDTINRGGTMYSLGGPPWAKPVVEVAGYAGLILCPFEALDPRMLTPKGMLVHPADEIPFDIDEPTDPGLLPEPVGDPQ